MFYVGQLVTFSDRAYQENLEEIPGIRALVLRVLHVYDDSYLEVELVNKDQLPDYEDYLLSGWLQDYYKPLPTHLYRRQTCH